MNIQEKQVVIDDILTTYYDSGLPQKPTLLFLHGWGSNSTLWFRSVEQLDQAGYRLIFLDLPGFGKTQLPTKPYTLDLYAEFVQAFIQKLGVKNHILIGHSFGGKIAARIAAKVQSDLMGVVFVDSSGLPHTNVGTKLKSWVAHAAKPFFSPSFMQDARTKLLRLVGSDDYVADPKLRQTFINIIQEHITFDLPRIKTHTLILWGGSDENSYSPPEDAYVFHQSIPNSELHIIENARHYSFLDAPDVFQNKIAVFAATIYGKN